MMYKENQKVKLSAQGIRNYYCFLDTSNPRDTIGTVEGLDTDLSDGEWWFVTWDNGKKNCYRSGDLEIVEE